MKKQDYFITKGMILKTVNGHMIVNYYDYDLLCLTEFDYAFHEVRTLCLTLEDIELLLHDMFGLEFNVIWKENFTRE